MAEETTDKVTPSDQKDTSQDQLKRSPRAWFFVRLKPETDVVALVALILAAASALTQVVFFFSGARVQLFIPDAILAVPQYFPDKSGLVQFVASMSYVNTAATGYNAVLRRETLSYRLRGIERTQIWNQFIDSKNLGHHQIKIDVNGSAKPVEITSASGTSHETRFWPAEKICDKETPNCSKWVNYLQWQDFLNSLKPGPSEIEFHLIADIYGKSNQEVTCSTLLSRVDIAELERDGWHEFLCHQAR